MTSNAIFRSITKRRVPVAMVVAAALVVSACGSDDASDATGDRVLTIGVLAPTEAGLVDFGRGIRNAVQRVTRSPI